MRSGWAPQCKDSITSYTSQCQSRPPKRRMTSGFPKELRWAGDKVSGSLIDCRRTGCAVPVDFDAEDAIQITLDHVKMFLAGVQGEAVGKVKGARAEDIDVTVRGRLINYAICFLPVAGIAEIQIPSRIEYAEVGIPAEPTCSIARGGARVYITARGRKRTGEAEWTVADF